MKVAHAVAHGVHGVVRLVAVDRPVARLVGDEFEHAHRTDRHVGRHLRPPRARRHPAAVGAGHLELVAVQMDGVVGHGEIAHPHAHAVAPAHHQRDRCRETRACSRSTD